MLGTLISDTWFFPILAVSITFNTIILVILAVIDKLKESKNAKI